MNTASNPANSTNAPYDAIVVGARCTGSPTAKLLARQGARVLLVDRATFPNDTMRTHFVRGTGTAALARWGLLDRVAATGCPPLRHTVSDFGDGPLAVVGAIPDANIANAPQLDRQGNHAWFPWRSSVRNELETDGSRV